MFINTRENRTQRYNFHVYKVSSFNLDISLVIDNSRASFERKSVVS